MGRAVGDEIPELYHSGSRQVVEVVDHEEAKEVYRPEETDEALEIAVGSRLVEEGEGGEVCEVREEEVDEDSEVEEGEGE